jgi:hypothetical protein
MRVTYISEPYPSSFSASAVTRELALYIRGELVEVAAILESGPDCEDMIRHRIIISSTVDDHKYTLEITYLTDTMSYRNIVAFNVPALIRGADWLTICEEDELVAQYTRRWYWSNKYRDDADRIRAAFDITDDVTPEPPH